jgi:phytoene desaturase
MLTTVDPRLAAPLRPDRRPVALVVGAGLGGLAAGVRLGAKGWRVLILDRLDAPGGRATALRRGGYRFDLGPTIVTVPQVFEALWTLADRRMAEDVDLRPLDPFYEIRFPDGARFAARRDTEAMRAEVARLSPNDLAGYDRFLRDSEARYRYGFENLGRRPMHRFADLLAALPMFALLRADRSTYGHAALRIKDERLRMALSFHPLFIGGDPFNVTSMYSLVAWLEKVYGVHYAMGGVGALAEGMAGLVRRLGGELRFGSEVDEITARDGRATGVRLVSGEAIAGDIVVSNADVGHTYARLLRRVKRRRWTDARLRRARWSNGLFVWYFGTRASRGLWPDVGHHTILNGPRYRGLVRDIFIEGKLAEDMSIYLHRPTVTDPSAAPPGCDAFYALAPVPHLGHARPVDWAAEAPRFLARMRAMLEADALPGLGERLTETHVMTPADFETRYCSPYGAGFSIEPRILQSAWFRPHNVSEELRGLYVVGAGSHPGAGLPGVVASAEVLDRLVPAAEAVA